MRLSHEYVASGCQMRPVDNKWMQQVTVTGALIVTFCYQVGTVFNVRTYRRQDGETMTSTNDSSNVFIRGANQPHWTLYASPSSSYGVWWSAVSYHTYWLFQDIWKGDGEWPKAMKACGEGKWCARIAVVMWGLALPLPKKNSQFCYWICAL